MERATSGFSSERSRRVIVSRLSLLRSGERDGGDMACSKRLGGAGRPHGAPVHGKRE